VPLTLLKRLTVLYAEDDTVLAESMRRTLDLFFAQVHYAENGDQAWALFQQSQIHAVILDVRLPGLNGLDVARKIRQQSREVPIVIISGYQDVPDLLAAASLHLVDYLVKPISFDKLNAVLQKMVEHLLACGLIEIELAPGLVYDLVSKSVYGEMPEVQLLTAKEALFLELLLKHRAKPVLLGVIEHEVYNDEMTLAALRNLVLRLRRKLGPHSRIETLKDVGYLWR